MLRPARKSSFQVYGTVDGTDPLFHRSPEDRDHALIRNAEGDLYRVRPTPLQKSERGVFSACRSTGKTYLSLRLQLPDDVFQNPFLDLLLGRPVEEKQRQGFHTQCSQARFDLLEYRALNSLGRERYPVFKKFRAFSADDDVRVFEDSRLPYPLFRKTVVIGGVEKCDAPLYRALQERDCLTLVGKRPYTDTVDETYFRSPQTETGYRKAGLSEHPCRLNSHHGLIILEEIAPMTNTRP